MLLLLVIIFVIAFLLLTWKRPVKEGIRRGRRGHRGRRRPYRRFGPLRGRGYAYYDWPYYYNYPAYYYPTNYNLCEDISYKKYRDCINRGKPKTLCADNLETNLRWC